MIGPSTRRSDLRVREEPTTEIQLPGRLVPSTPKPSGISNTIKLPFKRKRSDRSPEPPASKPPSSSSRADLASVSVPPRKKQSTSSMMSSSTGFHSTDHSCQLQLLRVQVQSSEELRFTQEMVQIQVKQLEHMQLSQERERKLYKMLIIGLESRQQSPKDEDCSFLQEQLQSSQEDLRFSNEIMQIQDKLLRHMRIGQEQERKLYEMQTTELESRQQSPKDKDCSFRRLRLLQLRLELLQTQFWFSQRDLGSENIMMQIQDKHIRRLRFRQEETRKLYEMQITKLEHCRRRIKASVKRTS